CSSDLCPVTYGDPATAPRLTRRALTQGVLARFCPAPPSAARWAACHASLATMLPEGGRLPTDPSLDKGPPAHCRASSPHLGTTATAVVMTRRLWLTSAGGSPRAAAPRRSRARRRRSGRL